MGAKRKEYRNKAIVILFKCGMNMYQICQAFGVKDKRNFLIVLKRDFNKYDLPKIGETIIKVGENGNTTNITL